MTADPAFGAAANTATSAALPTASATDMPAASRRRRAPDDPANPIPEASAGWGDACSVDRISEPSRTSSRPDLGADPIATAARYAAYAQDQGQVAEFASELVAALELSPDSRVRVAALGALVRGRNQTRARKAWRVAVDSHDRAVRRRAAELTPQIRAPAPTRFVRLLADGDQLVVDAACFAAGEIAWTAHQQPRIVAALIAAAHHPDALVRESAVAALGALGDTAGLSTILAACSDRPAVRRRAVLSLAPFEGAEVEAALRTALADTDWQTRQAAEDLL